MGQDTGHKGIKVNKLSQDWKPKERINRKPNSEDNKGGQVDKLSTDQVTRVFNNREKNKLHLETNTKAICSHKT